MVLTKLFQSIGIPMTARNFMVDYCDGRENYFHKPLQTIVPPGCTEDDRELISYIQAELSRQGFKVCGISEVLGDFEMDELEAVFNGSEYGKHPTRALYINVEMAMKEGRSSQESAMPGYRKGR